MLARPLLHSISLPAAIPNDAAWTRSPSNPILAAEPGEWDQGAVDGPSVLLISGSWHGWFAGSGPSGTFMGAMDSADGVTWTQHLTGGLSIPVLGGGHGGFGVGVSVYQPNVDYFDGTYFYAYVDDPTGTPNFCLSVARSTDGFTWTDLTRNILSFATGVDQWNTASVLKIGATYHMLVEGHHGTIWETFYATASNPMGPFTIGNGGNPLTSLQIAAGGMYGGPQITLLPDGLIHNYYHAAAASGTLPTNLYTATCSPSDFTTWTLSPHNPILTHSGVGNEVSQLADPCLVRAGSAWRLYYSAVWNQSPFQANLDFATTSSL